MQGFPRQAVPLDHCEASLGTVEEGKGLGRALPDADALRCGVRHIAADGSRLLRGNHRAGNQILNDNPSLRVCDEASVILPNRRAVRVCY